MTKYYVYRGVSYTKDGKKNIPVDGAARKKLYRGVPYSQLPLVKQAVSDHIYRGAHYRS